jgi:dTMP kinase
MFNKKPLFISFEGIEGSGKSYQSKILIRKIKKMKLPVVFTREPGGSSSAEKIRNLILSGDINKFDLISDTLLYLASRNEHILNLIKPALKKNKIIVCDRFIDSTYAYQTTKSKASKIMIDFIHKIILKNIKPDLTFILSVNIKKAFQRLEKRKKLNRYDKFPKSFYINVQKKFISIAKKNKKRCVIIDNSIDNDVTEKKIFSLFMKLYKNEK